MTVTWLQCDDVKMSLFQDLKLKRRKVDSRCSSDGESIAETSSSSAESGSSGETASSPNVLPAFSSSDSPRASPRLLPPLSGRTSPDSAGDEFGEVKSSLDPGREDDGPGAHVFDGGGDQHVTSTPIGLGASPMCGSSQPESMSTTPPPDVCDIKPDVSILQSALFSRPQQGCSLGAGGTAIPYSGNGGSIITSAGTVISDSASRGMTSSSMSSTSRSPSALWGDSSVRFNGIRYEYMKSGSNVVTSAVDSSNKGIQAKFRTKALIMGESNGVKTMFWAPSEPPSPNSPLSQGPRETLSSPGSTQSHFTVDTSDAVRVSVDSLLSLGQERRGSPQLSPSSSMSLSPSARSPMQPPRSPHAHSASPYSIAPSSPGFPQMVRGIRSPQITTHCENNLSSPSSSASSYHLSSTSECSRFPAPLNMEKLWAASERQSHSDTQPALNLSKVGMWSSGSKNNGVDSSSSSMAVDDDDDQPMICMICEDRATGLHYGIITCEGYKGFFKRTVQNKRVYTCVADGNCEITKAQRNRCQYCRFQKCLNQGMVLAAVREDRMPGGRNSGAVYNLYKVKYKKKKNKSGQARQGPCSPDKSGKLGPMDPIVIVGSNSLAPSSTSGHLGSHGLHPAGSARMSSPPMSPMPGNILKTALTNPAEVAHYRHRPDNAVSSTRERVMLYSTAEAMIRVLIDCDDFEDLATLRDWDDLLDQKSDLSTKLCRLGDSIGIKLVQWTKRLPFFQELPVEVHTHLLTSKWHELLVLTTSTYQAIYGVSKLSCRSCDGKDAEFRQEMSSNLCHLQTCLTSMMGRPFSVDTLRHDLEAMVEKITQVTVEMRHLKITMEEYVCLKVIILLKQAKSQHPELEGIQERYINCLRTFCDNRYPDQPGRVQELLVKLRDIQAAASLLIETKMFYVPFLLCSTITR